MINAKVSRKIERYMKAVSNHWRVRILDLLDRQPELSVGEITDLLKGDYQNMSDHIRKLSQSGLVMKRYEGSTVRHALTGRGKSILEFCKKLE